MYQLLCQKNNVGYGGMGEEYYLIPVFLTHKHSPCQHDLFTKHICLPKVSRLSNSQYQDHRGCSYHLSHYVKNSPVVVCKVYPSSTFKPRNKGKMYKLHSLGDTHLPLGQAFSFSLVPLLLHAHPLLPIDDGDFEGVMN